MRKLFLAVGVVVFFLIILAAILFKLFSKSDTKIPENIPVNFPTSQLAISDSASPSQFVISFYTWYLKSFAEDPGFPHSENRDQVLGQWVSGSLLNQWDQIVLEDEVNPLLLTGEDPASWGPGISASAVSQTGLSRTVRLTLGEGNLQHIYLVTLSRESDGSLKIFSVASSL